MHTNFDDDILDDVSANTDHEEVEGFTDMPFDDDESESEGFENTADATTMFRRLGLGR